MRHANKKMGCIHKEKKNRQQKLPMRDPDARFNKDQCMHYKHVQGTKGNHT